LRLSAKHRMGLNDDLEEGCEFRIQSHNVLAL
jgi:hypothetical protein